MYNKYVMFMIITIVSTSITLDAAFRKTVTGMVNPFLQAQLGKHTVQEWMNKGFNHIHAVYHHPFHEKIWEPIYVGQKSQRTYDEIKNYIDNQMKYYHHTYHQQKYQQSKHLLTNQEQAAYETAYENYLKDYKNKDAHKKLLQETVHVDNLIKSRQNDEVQHRSVIHNKSLAKHINRSTLEPFSAHEDVKPVEY